MPTNEHTQPWERRSGETETAYGAFFIYCNLPPETASIAEAFRVSQVLKARQPPVPDERLVAEIRAESLRVARQGDNRGRKAGRAGNKLVPSWWWKWSSKWEWVDRRAEWQGELLRRRREQFASELINAEDALRTTLQSSMVKLQQRVLSLQPNEIPPQQLFSALRQLGEFQLQLLGWSPELNINMTSELPVLKVVYEDPRESDKSKDDPGVAANDNNSDDAVGGTPGVEPPIQSPLRW